MTVALVNIGSYTYDPGGGGYNTISGTWHQVGSRVVLPVVSELLSTTHWYKVGFSQAFKVSKDVESAGGWHKVGYIQTVSITKTVPTTPPHTTPPDDDDDTDTSVDNWLARNWPWLAIGAGATGVTAIALVNRSKSKSVRKRK